MGEQPFTVRRIAASTVGLLTLVLVGACGVAGGAGVGAPPAHYLREPDEHRFAGLSGGRVGLVVVGKRRVRRSMSGRSSDRTLRLTRSQRRCRPPTVSSCIRRAPAIRRSARSCRCCRPHVHWPPPAGSSCRPSRETPAIATADETLDAFLRYVDRENDGRPFVVVSDSFEASLMSLAVLDEIGARPELRRQYIASVLPGMASDSDGRRTAVVHGARTLGLRHRSADRARPDIEGAAAPGITSGWAGACADNDLVDCDVLALVHAKIEAFGLTSPTTDSR